MTRLLTVCGSLRTASMNRAALAVAQALARTLEDVTVDDFDRLAHLPALNPDLGDEPGPQVDDWRWSPRSSRRPAWTPVTSTPVRLNVRPRRPSRR